MIRMIKEDFCKMICFTEEELTDGNAMIELSGFEIDALPEGLNILTLGLTECFLLKQLPSDLKVEYLNITRCPVLSRLPDGISLNGLSIIDSGVEFLPDDMSCTEDLMLMDCPLIEKLPETCVAFSENLFLSGCKGLTSIHGIRIVHGDLDISRTNISKLPENIIVGRNLIANDSLLETLPSGIRVGGSIDLSNCKKLKSLPEDMIVYGHLNLSGSSIHELPKHLKVGGILNLMSTSVNSLPEDLFVGKQIIGYTGKDIYETDKTIAQNNLSDIIWKNSGYIRYNSMLYKILSKEQDCWKVMDPYADVMAILNRNYTYKDNEFYIADNGRGHLGFGCTSQEAIDNAWKKS